MSQKSINIYLSKRIDNTDSFDPLSRSHPPSLLPNDEYKLWCVHEEHSNGESQNHISAVSSHLFNSWGNDWILFLTGWWCDSYCRKKWTQRTAIKPRMRLIVFHMALVPLRNVWIQLFSLQLWIHSRVD